MNNKKVKLLLKIGIPIVIVGGLAIYKMNYYPTVGQQERSNKKGDKSIPVNAYIVKAQGLSSNIQAVGTLMPNEEVDLVAETTGKVIGIYFEEGTRVKKGELLLKVDDADLQVQLMRAKYQQKLLSEQLERQRVLFQKDAVSREEYDKVQTDYNMVEADIALLEVKIARTELRAPFSGIIGFRNVSLGAYLQPSTIVSHLVDDNRLKVEFSIPEKYASDAKIGATVRFKTESSEKLFPAKVYAIDPRVDTQTRTILLRALSENTNHELSPGMFARIDLITSHSNRALLIPTQSVVSDMEGKSVWVVKDGKARTVPVETFQRTENQIEILSGLSIGDTVLVSGLMQVREDIPVTLSQVE